METMTQKKSARQRILDTTTRLFFKQGYQATGINQIIDQAGACKSSFYSNFHSKEELCLAYIKTSHENWMALLGEEISKQENAYERLLGIFTFLENWMNGCSYRGCGLMNISSEITEPKGRIRQLIQERNDILRKGICALVKDLKDSDSRYVHLDVEEFTSFLLMIIQGAIVSSQTHAQAVPIQDAKKSVKRFLETYIHS
jgi:AcrR family transcriptional regulator